MMDGMTLTSALTLLFTLGAVMRVTRLINRDVIFERWRGKALTALDNHEMLAYLLVCPWCLSMYTSAAGVGAWYTWGDDTAYFLVTLLLTISYVTGFVAERESE